MPHAAVSYTPRQSYTLKPAYSAGFFVAWIIVMSFQMYISHDIKRVQKQLTKIQQKQIPFATAKALTNTAQDAQRAVTKQLPKKLDRPTRFTLNAIGFSKATKTTLASKVFIKQIQYDYLRWQIDGGVKTSKGKGTGVPTDLKKLNKFGNIAGRKKGLVKGKNQFIATIHGISGVWQRFGVKKKRRHLKLIIAFERKVIYKPRLPFQRIVSKIVQNRFPKQFNKAIAFALATAK
ncbi:MAG: hypothetical protein JKY48_15025 [Flavobacteriales bacterium]|nr:hypothetical protein [Flavobacteriales bacterium]